MKKYLLIFSLIWLGACQQKVENIAVDDYLSETEQEAFKLNIVRYYEGLPKKATHETKFDSIFNAYYESKAAETDFLFYHKKDNGEIYFAIFKIAPSLTLKKVATIGKLTLDNDNNITYYEEICRTWKMPEEELKEKTNMLFQKVIRGEDISPYYTKNSQPEFIVEFPDDLTYFDTQLRRWKTKN
jgi:hypothetical protein